MHSPKKPNVLLSIPNDCQPNELKMTSSPPAEKAAISAPILSMAADIVSAYITNNAVPAAELPALIREIYLGLGILATGKPSLPAEALKEPAVPIKKSVTADFIVCLEDGQKFKSLKRHLSAAYGMSPKEYRTKWGLPADYPMVAPNYSTKRSALAKDAGLGQRPETAKIKPANKTPSKKSTAEKAT